MVIANAGDFDCSHCYLDLLKCLRTQMNTKLQQLKGPKRKQLQATKLSVEGRGMVKYL